MVLGAFFATAASVPWRRSLLLLPTLALLWQLCRLLHRLWWRPRCLERELRSKGLRGTSYRFLTGDLREQGRRNKDAWSRPLPLRCHDIAPRVAPLLCDSVREHGKVSLSWFGPIPKVTIADPELAKSVLSDKSGHFEKPKFPALWKLLANGLLNHEGEKWVKHRRLLNPAFHLEKIKTLQCMLPEFSACCEELVGRWTESIGSSGGMHELDIWPELKNLAGDVISRTAFGSSYLEGMKIFQLQTEQAERLIANIRRILIPGYLSLPTPNNKRMYQVNNEVESILHGLIAKRTKAIKEGESTKDDLLGLLLESNMRHTYDNGQSSMGMTNEDVTMILYEVLRLYPPSIHFSRKTCKKVLIGDKRYPAGMMIELSVLLMHHDPDIWGSDVHEFKPERFAEGISKASRNSGAFLPFGWGPRICIGQNFALAEAKMAICMILQRFDFVLAPSYTHAPYTVVTLHPMHGAQIRLGLI
uniref:Secologanin synthase n=1 Tax=Aegilops tauschii subsp. strangulata TaxID=200361 RepID=A0A453ICG6_AEGTS